MSNKQINRLNEKSLQGNILIEIRNKHVESIVNKILNPEYNIIPLEYIDEKIRLKYIKNQIEFIPNHESRITYLTDLLIKECSKGTSKLISEMCL
jgi:DNA polymerase II large subunit